MSKFNIHDNFDVSIVNNETINKFKTEYKYREDEWHRIYSIDPQIEKLRLRLCMAATDGDIGAMQYLAKSISIDTVDIWGNTPLTYAVIMGNIKGVRELLLLGADPYKENLNKSSPYTFAKNCMNNEHKEEMVRLFEKSK